MSIISGSSSDDTYSGTSSSDTAVIDADSANASFNYQNGVWVVTSSAGVDTLDSIESIQFSHEVFSLSGFQQGSVNTYTLNNQSAQAVTALTDGGYVITWQSKGQDGSEDGIYAQRYDSLGEAVGSEFRVNTYTSSYQSDPAIATLSDGSYVITWHSFKQDGNSYGIFAQRFSNDGVALGGETQVNSYTKQSQDNPDITALADGGYLITWQSYGRDGSLYGVYAQRFSSSGIASGSEIKINTYTNSFQGNPSVTTLNNGSYVIAWQSFGKDSNGYEIYTQLYTSAGVAVGSEARVNTYITNNQDSPAVTALSDGGYVVTWQSLSQDTSLYGVYAQRFDSSGAAVGAETKVNNYTIKDQDSVVVTALNDGGYLITWVSYTQDGSLYGIYSRRYDSDGDALGWETRVSSSSISYQGTPAVTTLADGGYIITWVANDGNGYGVYAQRFDASGALLSLSGDANANTLNYSGDVSIALSGLSGNDVLTGGSGNDTLDGGLGNDTMTGGLGNDTYIVDSSSDVVIEASSLTSEIDLIQSSVTYSLGTNQENLTLTGKSSINGTGNALNNTIKGNEANNILDGGLGDDTLTGGLGNDTYKVNSAGDQVVESSTLSKEIDEVISSVTFTLGSNIENLTLTGTSAINGTGNSLDNIIIGNSANNTLNGALGNDYINGMGGLDTLYINAGTSTQVSYAYDATTGYIIASGTTDGSAWQYTLVNVEQVQVGSTVTSLTTLFPAAFSRAAIVLISLSSDQNTLSSGETATITFTLSASSSDFTLSDITVSGGTLGSLSGSGTSYSAIFTPSSNSTTNGVVSVSSNKFSNASGTFNLDGADANNTVTLAVDTVAPTISSISPANTATSVATNANIVFTFSEAIQFGTGNIVLKSGATTIATYDVESPGLNLSLSGSSLTLNPGASLDTATTYTIEFDSGAIEDSAGNSYTQSTTYAFTTSSVNTVLGTVAKDSLIGTIGDDQLTGLGGDDILDGLTGADTMAGGMGNDLYVVDDTNDVVTEGAGAGTDWVKSSISYTLGNNIENLLLTDGSSNGGTDDLNGSGNALANIITGNAGDNQLDGGAGVDRLIGGSGNDTYTVDLTSSGRLQDTIVETNDTSNQDTLILRGTLSTSKRISIVLATNLENLDGSATGSSLFNLTGNAAANTLTGNSAANVLDGKSGADVMIGGAGDDTYIVDNLNDTVTESASQGTDLVRVAIGQSNGSYALATNVENGILINTVAFSLEGNGLDNTLTGNAAANTLSGGAGNDVLDGAKGADTLEGGAGDDVYYVDSASDVVNEVNGSGTDTVMSVVTYTLNRTESAGVENLTLTGSRKINATGNALDNLLLGNRGANTLDGGLGDDTLTGGAGKDVFLFNATDYASATDTLTDFVSGTDKIMFNATIFTSLQTDKAITSKGVALSISDFVSATNIVSSSNTGAHLLYDSDSGRLFYDADGAGADSGVQIALLGNLAVLTTSDFVVANL